MSLPPLLCDTPPPIDDFPEFPENEDEDFGEFESPDVTLPDDEVIVTSGSQLPVPPPLDLNFDHEISKGDTTRPAKTELEEADPERDGSISFDENFTLNEDELEIEEESPSIETPLPRQPLEFPKEEREEPDGSEGDVEIEVKSLDPPLSSSFDDFCDFRSAPKSVDEFQKTQFPDLKQENWEPGSGWDSAPAFETDFGSFEASFPSANATDVIKEEDNPPAQAQTSLSDDDDDFGDFNEAPVPTFQEQVPNPVEEAKSITHLVDLSKFVEVLDSMFPKDEGEDAIEDHSDETSSEILKQMRDIEASEALKYKYANSKTNVALMDAIGIDSKNVLFGMKWNSSMPRFAANLSFDPIQPQAILQPTKVEGPKGPEPNRPVPSDVPVAQFDWSGAGLVNPLDGPLEAPAAAAAVPTAASPVFKIPVISDDSAPSVAPPNEEKPAPLNPSLFDDFELVAPIETPARSSIPLSPASSGGGYSMRTITLPETHIFTPEKGTSTISQSVDREACYSPDILVLHECDPSQKVAVPPVKEYRDIEYSLKPESVPVASIFESFTSTDEPSKSSKKLEPKKDNFPIFGTSPTEGSSPAKVEDDEFSDFQAAPPPIEPLKRSPITLSPEHLLRESSWSALDDDEMLRIEAFARSKNVPAAPAKETPKPVQEDDEWTDFVSSAPPSKTASDATRDDDWSDFVFTTPASSQPILKNTWNSPLPATYTAGNYVPWSTGQSTTPAINSGAMPELGFVAPSKGPTLRNQLMRK